MATRGRAVELSQLVPVSEKAANARSCALAWNNKGPGSQACLGLLVACCAPSSDDVVEKGGQAKQRLVAVGNAASSTV